jgi:hypothetical protein
MGVLHTVLPFLLLAGGVWAIVYWLYPYMKLNTSNPVLYTVLAIVGVFALYFLLPKLGISGFGKGIIIGDFFKLFSK